MTKQRLNMYEVVPEGFGAVLGLEKYVREAVASDLLHLVKLRASMINGCAYCVDMHSTDALAEGEDVRRLAALSAWEESPFFTEAERSALALTDAVTRIDGGVTDEVWNEAVDRFGERLAADLVLAIAAINVWNRVAITSRTAPPPLAS